MSALDTLMMAAFVLFLGFLLRGVAKQSLAKDEFRRKQKDKK